MRIMLWILGGLAVFALIAGVVLQLAIIRNGPAVLSTVDRIAGGSRDAELKGKISTGAHPEQQVLVWGPARRDPADAPLPVLLFAHGGSWRSGNPVDYGFIGHAFVPNGFIVVLAGYRLGEAGKYPAMLEDTARAIEWTHSEIAAYGGDPEKIVIAGHSAGAYNVVMAALEEQWLGRRGLSAANISGVVALSGPYDFVPLDSDSTIASFGHVEPIEKTQPVEHIGGPDEDSAPPMLLIHGEQDTLVRPRNTRLLADKLAEAGNRVDTVFKPEMDHNQPLISLAAPWRSRGDLVEVISRFALATTTGATQSQTANAETSVPVQEQTR